MGDQGRRPTCFAWATTAAHEHRRNEELSVEYLHWACGPPAAARGTRPAMTRALKSPGQPPESQWPYDPDRDESASTYTPPSSVVGPFQTATTRSATPSIDLVRDALLAGDIPIAGIRVTPAFHRATDGVIDGIEQGTDGHAICLVGVVEATRPVGSISSGGRLVCVRNSWGPDWGASGHALMTERAFLATSLFVLVLND
ncbi:C1 family peptidase [Actinomycetospora atypica]|uniref:C1 family peptidase n=1 Tax=Actinomycetospora atypica TaxID=1290095 RepID=A0ABV9YFK7_9PSEU